MLIKNSGSRLVAPSSRVTLRARKLVQTLSKSLPPYLKLPPPLPKIGSKSHKKKFLGISCHMPYDKKCCEICQYGYLKNDIDQMN